MTANTSDSQKLTPKQQALLQHLLAGHTMLKASELAKVAESTAHRWIKQPEFKAALTEAANNAVKLATGQLAELTQLAVAELKKILEDDQAAHRDKIRAIDLQLANVVKLTTHSTQQAEIEALQAEIEEIKAALLNGNSNTAKQDS